VRKYHARLRRLESRTVQDSCVDAPLVFLWPHLNYLPGQPPREHPCPRCGECHTVVLHEEDEPEDP